MTEEYIKEEYIEDDLSTDEEELESEHDAFTSTEDFFRRSNRELQAFTDNTDSLKPKDTVVILISQENLHIPNLPFKINKPKKEIIIKSGMFLIQFFAYR